MPRDPDLLRKNLRKDTCRLLKYDLDHLTAAQEVRLARATMLRLTLDDIEQRLLNNAQQEFDTKAYVVASESLERLVGGDPSSSASVETEEQMRERLVKEMFSKDAEALDQLFHRRIDARKQRAARLEANNGGASQTPPSHALAPGVSFETPEPSSPAPELMPENFEPPKSNVQRASYIDNAVLEETPTDRHRRVNGGDPRPATERPASPTTRSFFSDIPSAGGLGPLKRGDDWLPKGNG